MKLPLKCNPKILGNNDNGERFTNLDALISLYIISNIEWSRGLTGGFGRVLSTKGAAGGVAVPGLSPGDVGRVDSSPPAFGNRGLADDKESMLCEKLIEGRCTLELFPYEELMAERGRFGGKALNARPLLPLVAE